MVGITEEVGVVETAVTCEPLRVDREPPAFSAIENVAMLDIPMQHRDLALAGRGQSPSREISANIRMNFSCAAPPITGPRCFERRPVFGLLRLRSFAPQAQTASQASTPRCSVRPQRIPAARGRHVRDRQCGGGCGRRLVNGQDFTETTLEPPGCGCGIAACCRSRAAAGRGLAFRLRSQLPRGGHTGKKWGRPWPAPKQVTSR
jgi:hypothetical protein